jgi:hypothetical protein
MWVFLHVAAAAIHSFTIVQGDSSQYFEAIASDARNVQISTLWAAALELKGSSHIAAGRSIDAVRAGDVELNMRWTPQASTSDAVIVFTLHNRSPYRHTVILRLTSNLSLTNTECAQLPERSTDLAVSSAALNVRYWISAADNATVSCGNSTAAAFAWDVFLSPSSNATAHLSFRSRTPAFVLGNEDGPTPSPAKAKRRVWPTFAIGAGLALPNVAAAVSWVAKGGATPITVLVLSLFLDFAYGGIIAFVLDHDDLTGVIVASLGGLAWLFGVCVNVLGLLSGDHSGLFRVIHAMWHPRRFMNGDDLAATVKRNRAAPPRFDVVAKSCHQESREVRSEGRTTRAGRWVEVRRYFSDWGSVAQGGGRFLEEPGVPAGNVLRKEPAEYRDAVTWTTRAEIPFASWAERGTPVRFPDVMLLKIDFRVDYRVDAEMTAAAEQRAPELLEQARGRDSDVNAENESETLDWVEHAEGGVRGEDLGNHIRRCSSWPARVFWVVCFVTGFQTLFEWFADTLTATIEVACLKEMCSSAVYRCRYVESDTEAAAHAILQEGAGSPGRGAPNDVLMQTL